MPCLTTWYCEGYPVEAAKSRVTCVLYVTRNGDNLQTQMLLKKLEFPPPPLVYMARSDYLGLFK